jgi:hypothetical protein
MGAFSDVFEAEKKEDPRGPKGFKGLKAPNEPLRGPLSTLKTLLAPRHNSENPWPYATAADEPRCPTCRHWWRSDVVNQAGEALGDCLLLNLETAAGENCKGHDAQQGSARRARR